jgi:RNA 3'-terminal phosphate cyclase (ATP)
MASVQINSVTEFENDCQLKNVPLADSAENFSVNGSLLEGGGQVLRNAIAYCAIFRRNLHIHAIRAGRESGGLKRQHLTGVELIHKIYGGELTGASLNSTEIVYKPSKKAADDDKFEADVQSAGAIGLVLQTALIPTLYLQKPTTLVLKGGTDVDFSPMIDFTRYVFIPTLKRLFSLNVDCEVVKRGFNPVGEGIISVKTNPINGSLNAFNMIERGNIIKISGICLVTPNSKIPTKHASIMVSNTEKLLKKHFGDTINLDIKDVIVDASQHIPKSNGISILLIAHTSTGCMISASRLGTPKSDPEKLSERCVKQLMFELEHGGCVDEYMQDQLIMFMALANGTSKLKTGQLSLHTRTCLYWAQKFANSKVKVYQSNNNSSTDTKQTYIIEISGICHK